MSIENEEWVRSHDAVWVAGTGEHVAECASKERADQVVAGKKALELLKQVVGRSDTDPLVKFQADEILLRVGVLK